MSERLLVDGIVYLLVGNKLGTRKGNKRMKGFKRKGIPLPAYYESASFWQTPGRPVDLNCKPQAYSGSGRGGAGSGR